MRHRVFSLIILNHSYYPKRCYTRIIFGALRPANKVHFTCAPVGTFNPIIILSVGPITRILKCPPLTVQICFLVHLQNLQFHFQQFHYTVVPFKRGSRTGYVMGIYSNLLPSFSHAETALLDFWHVTVNSG
jgi:hypothetical protein